MNERRSLQLLAEKYEQVREEGLGGNRTRISDEKRNEIINMFRQGVEGHGKPDDTNTAKIAQLHNISVDIVNDIIKQSGVVGRGRGHTQRGSESQPSGQRIPPAQIEYIKDLLSKRDSEGVFEYSSSVILKMVNEYTDAHPELDWYKIKDSNTLRKYYIKRWEERNIPGKTRMDFGVKKSNGIIVSRGTGQRIRAPRVLDPNDNSYKTANARGQPINDQDTIKVVNGYTSGL